MVGQEADRTSLICLLFPFFGVWILFWLVPLVMGIDLSMQNPDRNAVHWEDASEVGGGSEKQVYSWLSTGPDLAVQSLHLKHLTMMKIHARVNLSLHLSLHL